MTTSRKNVGMVGKFTIEEIEIARAAVFDTSLDIMYIFDIDTLQILDMNPSGLYELGYTLKEIREKDFIDLHAIEERERASEIVAMYRKQGYIHNVRDLHLRRKDGSLIPVEKNGRVTTVNGKPIGH
ncbi:MAG: PAS domain S-box protein [Actinomycetota bacterium]|nr:PAS domain S-box protein [Actinomycetota bacterium]